MGPERWGKEFPTCAKGKSQSPLDIRGPFVKTRTVVTADYKEGPLKLLNNGHTIQVNANPGSKLRIDGVAYDLLQFHFHRPSEEKIDGKPMAMVAHFVHKSKAGKLAVIGVLLKEGKDNDAINVLWDNAPAKEGPEVKLDKISFDPGKLIPSALTHYAYEGSLTTPPCTEGVNFYILKTPVDISKAQVAKFPFKMNARPVQPLNGRKIGAN
jgi:carbonic anhydrase